MTQFPRANIAMVYVRRYVLAFFAASSVFIGLQRFVLTVSHPVVGGLLRLVNAVIQKAFREVLPLPDRYSSFPWQILAVYVAQGTIFIVLGVLVGLWANHREYRQSAN
jgi:hypothetical protein